MRNGMRVLAVLAAFGAWGATGAGTPLALIPAASAEALPAVWVNKVKKIAKGIQGARRNLAADPAAITGDDFKSNQFMKRIENFAASLSRVPATDDPVLTEAQAMLAALRTEFDAAKGGAPAPSAPAATAATAPAAAPSATASTAPAPAAASAAPAGDVRPLVSGERVRVKKLTLSMTNVLGAIKTEGPSLYQDPLEYNAAVKRFTQFTDAMKKYPQADDPDVMAARAAYSKLRATLQAELQRGKEQYDILGDVPGNLRALQGRDKEFPIPPALKPPFDKAAVETWLTASRTARDAAKKDYKYIADIASIAYLPEYTKSGRKAEFGAKDLPRLAAMTENRYKRANGGLAATQRNIKSALEELDRQVQMPTARTGPEDLARHRGALDDMLPIAQSGVTLQQVLGRPTDEAEAVVAGIRDRRKTYEATREAAIDAVRMPKPVSDDAERLAIAKDVVARPKYEFGEHGPIILNTSEILEKERKESEIEIDDVDVYGGEIRMSGTQETTVWKWKEFQFATTPLNQWISGGVVEGEYIRAEHVGK